MVPTSPITSRPIDNVEPYTMHNGKMVRQHTFRTAVRYAQLFEVHSGALSTLQEP